MKIKTPAIFLSFDDHHIAEWNEALPVFARHDAKVTFYISNIPEIDEIGWRQLEEIREAGHTIAFHGLNHIRAGLTVAEYGCQAYMETEILPGLEALKENGFNGIRHFSYPYGNRITESDECLWKKFDTIRMGGVRFYTPREIQEARLINAFSFGARSERKIRHFEDGVRKGAVICTYMHRPKGKITPRMDHPMEYWLERILDFGHKNGATFYPMEVLNR